MTVSTPAELVMAKGRRRTIEPGEYLFVEGDPSRDVYVCASGRIKLSVSAPSGREVILGAKHPGELFGELSALDGGRRSACASAVEASVVCGLTAPEFLDGLRSAPGLALQLLRELSEHLRRANVRTTARDSDSLVARVAQRLVELDGQLCRHGSGARQIPITQEDLAGWVGATRESTARALSSLRRAGAVRTGRGWIQVADIEAMSSVLGA